MKMKLWDLIQWSEEDYFKQVRSIIPVLEFVVPDVSKDIMS